MITDAEEETQNRVVIKKTNNPKNYEIPRRYYIEGVNLLGDVPKITVVA